MKKNKQNNQGGVKDVFLDILDAALKIGHEHLVNMRGSKGNKYHHVNSKRKFRA